MLTADMLLRAAKRAALSAIDAAVGIGGRPANDRQSWAVKLSDANDQAALDAFLATYDPDTSEEVAADADDQAASQITTDLRVYFLAFFRMTNRRDPTPEETAEWSAAVIQAARDLRDPDAAMAVAPVRAVARAAAPVQSRTAKPPARRLKKGRAS